ncbi:MAG: histidine kinase dimerization/phosphoacceptor domain -containing protein [Bacteroidales bacterium]|nr:histidine kinase dimerization/phosphoacceptor domain -containing protein [Bacteroidales bacterium]
MNFHSKKKLRREFQDFYMISSLPTMRIGLFLTLVLFTCFVIFNYIFFPDSPEQFYYQRFGIISPVLVISILVTYFRPLYKWLHLIYIFLNLLVCVAIFNVGIHSDFSQPGSEYYYTWVMLVVIGLFVFYRMPFYTNVIIGLIQITAFIAATIFNHTLAQKPFFFYNNLFFVFAIYSIGFILAFMFRTLNWKNFLHQKAISKNNLQLQEEINERKQAVVALQLSETQYHNTIDSIPDWIFVVDRNFHVIILNSSLKYGHIGSGQVANTSGKSIDEILPFMPSDTIDELNYVFDQGKILVTEEKISFIDTDVHMEIRKVPIFNDRDVIQVMTILRDRSKEKEVEALKQKNAEQKEIMLREIHHRVKNNLAIVISLLNLQLRNNTDQGLVRIIRDIEMRIRSMALIHEHLYRGENLDRIPLATYLHSLATIITSTFSGHRVNLVTSLDVTDVSIEIALPIGLITNELLTNAYKYAFPRHQDGEIQIHLNKAADDQLTLMIKDNGVGLPDSFSMDSEKSLGMFIVKLLVQQLDGNIDYSGRNGTSFTIQFRNLLVKRQVFL